MAPASTLTELVDSVLSLTRRVDATHHAHLAMTEVLRVRHELLAVEPDRLLVLRDLDVERLLLAAAGGDGLEARVEAVVDRVARVFEGALGDGVVLGDEVEADGVAGLGMNIVRRVGESTVFADDDIDDLAVMITTSGEAIDILLLECHYQL